VALQLGQLVSRCAQYNNLSSGKNMVSKSASFCFGGLKE
jgi:hypothetical protein